ncbi:MAG: toxin-antitoxin system YwqK family antitoxin [Pseudomonadota bacterium]|jgi:antitoxin component YwqK of YwqJK toxin-antitoxin module|nr:hypothetical protein [Alphaproteobacteria bacterium]
MSIEAQQQIEATEEPHASNSNTEAPPAESAVPKEQATDKSPVKKSPIKELAEQAANHNAGVAHDGKLTYTPGYEKDFQENAEIHEEDDESEEEEDDDDDPKEDPHAPEHEVKTQKIGSKTLQTELSRGLKQGLTSIKTKDGHYEMQAHYVKDKLDGLTTYYFANGKVEREIHFKHGKMHGSMKAFHENGLPSMDVEYEDGLMHGTTIVYDDFGQKQVESHYQKGKLHGDTIVFSNGKPYLKKTYHEGKETHQEYDASAAHSC